MLTIFAGSGASSAVNETTYPTTKRFFEQLPKNVTKQRLFQLLLEFSQGQRQGGLVDVEQLLWYIGELLDGLAPLSTDGHIAAWFAGQNRLHNLVRRKFDSRATFELLKEAAKMGADLRDAINRRVYDHYGSQPRAEELAKTWTLVFDWIGSHTGRVEIFTTNYDVVIEEAIRSGAYSQVTGRTSETLPRLREELWREELDPTAAGPGLLTKLHGSVDWIRSSDGKILTSTGSFVGDHERHVILYPGFKGRPDRAPFDAFHSWFAKALRVTSHALFIGFAFRDPYINDLVRESLPEQAGVVVIDPAEHIELAGLGTRPLKHIKAGFSNESFHEAIRALELERSSRDAA